MRLCVCVCVCARCVRAWERYHISFMGSCITPYIHSFRNLSQTLFLAWLVLGQQIRENIERCFIRIARLQPIQHKKIPHIVQCRSGLTRILVKKLIHSLCARSNKRKRKSTTDELNRFWAEILPHFSSKVRVEIKMSCRECVVVKDSLWREKFLCQSASPFIRLRYEFHLCGVGRIF